MESKSSLSLPSKEAALQAFPRGANHFDDKRGGYTSMYGTTVVKFSCGDDEDDASQQPDAAATAAARADLLALLARYPALTELKLKGEPCVDDDYSPDHCYSKQMLPESYVTTVLDGLAPSVALSTLVLSGCVVAPATLARCLPLRPLTQLDLSYSVVAGSGGDVDEDALLRVVAALTALTSLSLRDFANYYTECDGPMWVYELGRGAPHLSALSSLTSLNLRNTSGYSLQGLKAIGGLTTLRQLNMRGVCYSKRKPPAEGVMTLLSGLTNLELLDLKNTYYLMASPSDAELASLACLTALQTLRVGLVYEEEYGGQTHQLSGVYGPVTATVAGVEALRSLTALKKGKVDLTDYFDDALKKTLKKTVPSLAAKCTWIDNDAW